MNINDSGNISDDDEIDDQDELPKSVKNYITPAGFSKMREELRVLLYEERPKLVKVVSWAASNGDRSENGDYLYGKRRLREIDRRVRFLQKRLDCAEVIDPGTQKSDRVLFGATVTTENEGGVLKTFRIVGVDEIDLSCGDISWTSPVGKALLNSKEGDVVTVRIPRGEEDLEIVRIRYLKVGG